MHYLTAEQIAKSARAAKVEVTSRHNVRFA